MDEEKNRLEKEAERLVELGDDPSAQVMLEDVYERWGRWLYIHPATVTGWQQGQSGTQMHRDLPSASFCIVDVHGGGLAGGGALWGIYTCLSPQSANFTG